MKMKKWNTRNYLVGFVVWIEWATEKWIAFEVSEQKPNLNNPFVIFQLFTHGWALKESSFTIRFHEVRVTQSKYVEKFIIYSIKYPFEFRLKLPMKSTNNISLEKTTKNYKQTPWKNNHLKIWMKILKHRLSKIARTDWNPL